MSQCDLEKGCGCETTQTQQQECCPVEKSIKETPCPVEMAVDMWSASFFQAMKQTQVEILKEKIKKTWGPMMNKKGDAIVQAMGIHWESMMAQAKAQCDLRETLKSIFQEAEKK